MKKKFTLIFIVTLGLTSLLKAQTPTDSLLLYLPFNGNVNDESGNDRNVTNEGATLTSNRFGAENSAYLFDGNNDYIQVASSEKLNNLSNEITISSWVKANYEFYQTVLSIGSSNVLFGFAKYLRPGIIYRGLTVDYGTSENYWSRILPYYAIPENEWTFIATTYSSTDSVITIYVNDSIVHNSQAYGTITPSTADLFIGKRDSEQYPEYYKGTIDDIRVYNRALSKTEITALFEGMPCIETFNDTTIYYVSDIEFQAETPKLYFESTDSLTAQSGGCDSIVHRYTKFVFNTNYCSDSISVTDTLIIDIILTGLAPQDNVNSILVYPNPAHEYVIINTGDFNQMSNYNLKIVNTLSQTVFENLINQAEFQINLNDFDGYGLYFIKIFDDQGKLLHTRKLILQ